MYFLKQQLPKILLLVIPLFLFSASLTYAGVVSNMFYSFAVTVFGSLMWIGGLLLDFGIERFVIGFGDDFSGGLGTSVNLLWSNVRDLFNLTFIFGLVYLGFKMILNSDDSNTRRWLAHLLLAALLVNFSLFITKFVVDASNILATQIASSFVDEKSGEVAISTKFMDELGITSAFGRTDPVTKAALDKDGFGFVIGNSILFIVGAFVFGAGGILLTIRYAALILYMILSPLMFLGWVFPGLSSVTATYWKGFLGRAFFAPFYLLFLYFALIIIGTLRSTVGDADFATSFTGDGNAVQSNFDSTFPPFILASVFLIAAITIANKMSDDVAGQVNRVALNTANRGRKGLQRAITLPLRRGGGVAARGLTAGLGSRLDSQINRMQTSNSGGARRIGRFIGANSTYQATQNAMQNSRFGLSRTREQETQARNTIDTNADREMRFNANQPAPITAQSTHRQIATSQDSRRAQETAVREMSNPAVLDMARRNSAQVMSPEFASLMSDAQVEALGESGILNNTDMTTLRQNRDIGTFEEINNTLTNGNATTDNLNAAVDNLNRAVGSMSDVRIRNMAPGERNQDHVAAAFSQAQADAYMQSDDSQARKDAFRQARNRGQMHIVQHGTPSLTNQASPGAQDTLTNGFQDQQRRRAFRNVQQAGKMSAAALAHPNAREYLSPRVVEEFLNNNPSSTDIGLVRTSIEDYITDPTTPNAVTKTWERWMNKTVAGRRFV